MVRAAEFEDHGIDLDGIDMLRSTVEEHGHVVAGARAHDQRAANGAGGEGVGQVVSLADPRVVAGHGVAPAQGQRDLMERSVGRDLEPGPPRAVAGRDGVVGAVLLRALGSRNHQDHQRGYAAVGEKVAPPTPEEREAEGEHAREPQRRERPREAERGEQRDARQRSRDVPSVARERPSALAEAPQALGHDLSKGHEAGGGEDEEQQDRRADVRHHRGVGRQVVIEKEEVIGGGVLREHDPSERGSGEHEHQQRGRPHPTERPAPGAQASQAEPQEGGDQHEVRVVREHAYLTRQPSDERQLLEQGEAGRGQQLKRGRAQPAVARGAGSRARAARRTQPLRANRRPAAALGRRGARNRPV